ncbi:MAG TPA: hypothetical protein PKD23_06665 [Bellilinea sp.]|nr:hypothetical protein [Bellilinea sp.]
MAEDKKITQLTELTTPSNGDLIPIVHDPTGIPLTMYITPANLQAALTTRMANLEVGWIALPNGTRVSDTSFTLPGNWSALLRVGVKWKGYNVSQKYSYILSSTFSSGTNLTTVNLVANLDYSLASGVITNTYFSYASPPDFPSRFNYPVALTASTTNPVVGDGRLLGAFTVTDTTCRAWINFAAGSTTTFGSGTWNFSMPMIAGTQAVSSLVNVGNYYARDASTSTTVVGIARLPRGSSTLNSFFSSSGATVFAPTSPFTWANGDFADIAIDYTILND